MLSRFFRLLSTAIAVVTALACTTTRTITEPFIFGDPRQLAFPLEVRLRTVELVSNELPLVDDYPLIVDSLSAAASRYGFVLSASDRGQPYLMELAIHEHSYAADLVTRTSVMAVLKVTPAPSAPAALAEARVVYSSVGSESIVSLSYVYRIGEAMFASLRREAAERGARDGQAAAHATAGRSSL